MRITQNNFYNRFITDQQQIKQELDRLNRQIASGVKIQYGYEDPQVFADTLRLDYEETTLTQAVDVATDAQNFANNSDSVMYQFTDGLTRFKTLLVQAANGTNADSNYYAIANELKSLKDHFINLGNTSINGRYLFSGSKLDVRPLDAEGNYYGNDQEIKAVAGAGVEIPYNIPGTELFFGEDLNINRKVTTNIPLTLAGSAEPATRETTLAEITGNNDTYDFTLNGRRSDGSTFSTTLSLGSDKTVGDLLDALAGEYGSDLVTVDINNGFVEVTDKINGSSLLDLHMYGANSTDPTQTIDFVRTPGSDTSVYKEALFQPIDSSRLRANVPLILVEDATNGTGRAKGDYAATNTLLKDLSAADTLNGQTLTVDVNGTNTTVNIDDTTTVQDLLNAIDSAIGSPDARATLDSQGRIVIENLNGTDTVTEFALYSDETPPSLLFNANDALTVDDPKHDFFAIIDEAIAAVENGLLYPDGNNDAVARNAGIENAMAKVDHALSHIGKEHTKIGAMSNSLNYTVERSETLKLNVQVLRSEVLDTDVGEASVRLNQLSINYQALMASVAKVQNLSLVNYI